MPVQKHSTGLSAPAMTQTPQGRVICSFTFGRSESAVGESPLGSVSPSTQTADPSAPLPPDFLLRLVALASFMRLSLTESRIRGCW
jgi:hypothetical protein